MQDIQTCVDVFDPVVERLTEFLAANRSAPVPALVDNHSVVHGGVAAPEQWWDPPVVYRRATGEPTWIALQAEDDLDSLEHAPAVAREVIAEAWEESKDYEAAGHGVGRLVISHELPAGVGETFSPGQRLSVAEAKALVRSEPDPLRAAMASARSQARLERRVGDVHKAVKKMATPANMVVAASIGGAVITVQWLTAMAAAVAMLDPVVALQFRSNDGQAITIPVVAWDW